MELKPSAASLCSVLLVSGYSVCCDVRSAYTDVSSVGRQEISVHGAQ